MVELLSDVRKEYNEWKGVFWRCFVVGLLSYSGYITTVTYAVDDYGAIFHTGGAIVSGRWVIDFVHNVVCRGNLMPALIPLLCIAIYIFVGVGICTFWDVRKDTRFLLISLWSIHPYLLDVYNVRFAALSLAIGFLITMAALIAATRGKWGFVASVILFYLALSTYQPVIGFAIAAIMMQILLICVRGSFSIGIVKKCGRLLSTYLWLLVVSVPVYYALTKIIFWIFNVPVNTRFEAGFLNSFDQFIVKICLVATVLFVRLGPVKEFVIPFIGKGVIFAIYIMGTIVAVRKARNLRSILDVLLWIAMVPVGSVFIIIPLESSSMPWRICIGIVVFFVGMFALSQEADSKWIRKTGLAAGVFLLVYFIFNNNMILYKQHLCNEKDVVMANRLIAKIQSLPDYKPGLELAVVGRCKKEDFTKEGKNNIELVREYIKYSSIRRYSLATSAFEADWSKYSFLLNYCGLELGKCSVQSLARAETLVQDKIPWPDRSSVFIQDGIVVVFLAPPDE
jgi:hypothetical protein